MAAAGEALGADEAALVVVFASPGHDLEALVAAIAERSHDAPLIGCSTAGEIATAGPTDGGVVVIALGGDGFSVATGVAGEASTRLRAAGAQAARCVSQLEPRPHRVLMLLTDGLAGDQQEIVHGAYGEVGAAVPLVGGCAGDDLRMRETFQLYGNRVLTDSVVSAAIGSDSPLGVGVCHGWRRIGEPMLVSESRGNRVYSLDDEPALDLYLERLQAPEETRRDPAAFTAFALTHPLGLDRRGEARVRLIGEADFEDRSLGCIAAVPQGALVWFMEGDVESVLDATDAACLAALAPLGGAPPLGMFAFDCIARRGVLGAPGIGREVDRIASLAGGAPVAGFYTYGEIARTRGVAGFHNQTIVVLAVA